MGLIRIRGLDYVLFSFILLSIYFRAPVQFFRPDISWDLLNYHLSNGVGGQSFELHPSLIQTFFNPFLDQLFVPLHTKFNWPISNLVLLLFPCLTFVIIRFAIIPKIFDSTFRFKNSIAATSVTGTFIVSQYFTQSNDLILTPFIVMGLFLLLPGKKQSLRRVLVAAFLIGLCASLKLTFLYILIGSSISMVIFCLTNQIPRKWCLFYISSVALFFGFTYAPWALILFQKTENPFFPFFNSIFDSQMYNPSSFENNRFGMLAHRDFFISLPFDVISGNQKISELNFFDLRIPMFYLVIMLMTIFVMRRHLSSNLFFDSRLIPTDLKNCITLVVPSFFIWGALLGIGRYLIPLEVLMVVICFSFFVFLLRSSVSKNFTVALICTSLAFSTSYVNWNYGNYGAPREKGPVFPLYSIDSGLKEQTAVLLLNSPTGFLRVMFKNDLNHIFLSPYFNNFNLAQQTELIGNLPISYVSLKNATELNLDILAAYAVKPNGQCEEIDINYFPGLQICGTSRLVG
jgi:hypothetical protein